MIGALVFVGTHACDNTIVAVGTAAAQGGAGGVGGDPSNNGGDGGGTIGACGTPLPVGQLRFCGGTGAVGAGMPFVCYSAACDDNDNQWELECSDMGCSCQFNFTEVCNCMFSEVQPQCGGSDNHCCPGGWPVFIE